MQLPFGIAILFGVDALGVAIATALYENSTRVFSKRTAEDMAEAVSIYRAAGPGTVPLILVETPTSAAELQSILEEEGDIFSSVTPGQAIDISGGTTATGATTTLGFKPPAMLIAADSTAILAARNAIRDAVVGPNMGFDRVRFAPVVYRGTFYTTEADARAYGALVFASPTIGN